MKTIEGLGPTACILLMATMAWAIEPGDFEMPGVPEWEFAIVAAFCIGGLIAIARRMMGYTLLS